MVGPLPKRVALSPPGTDTVYPTPLYVAGDPAWGTESCLEWEARRQSSPRPIWEHNSPLCFLTGGLSSPSCHHQQVCGEGMMLGHKLTMRIGVLEDQGPMPLEKSVGTVGLMRSAPNGGKRTPPPPTWQLAQNVTNGVALQDKSYLAHRGPCVPEKDIAFHLPEATSNITMPECQMALISSANSN